MKQLSKKKLLWIIAVISVVTVILAWPVGTWLECRKMQVKGKGFLPDAVYLVAGARDQARRIEKMVEVYGALLALTNSQVPVVLVGNDRLTGGWSGEVQKNLTMGEWAAKRISERMQKLVGMESSPGLQIVIVPGEFSGTDGEMDILAGYLKDHVEIGRLEVVTSPFHVRRLLWRLSKYLARPVEVKVVTAQRRWTDRAPWTVLVELFKMGRDALGLSRAPILSRRTR